MARFTVVALALLFGICLGLTHEPDSGTAASVGAPDIAGATVGANHAKPVPKIRSVSELLAFHQIRTGAVVVISALLLGFASARIVRPAYHDDRDPSVVRSLARFRRGPPALV